MFKRYLTIIVTLTLILSIGNVGLPDEESVAPVGPEAPSDKFAPGEEVRITQEWKDTSLREILQYIAKKANVTIIPDISVDESVIVEYLPANDLTWRDVLNEAVKRCNCFVEEIKDGYFRVEKMATFAADFSKKPQPIVDVITQIAKIAGKNIIIDKTVTGDVRFAFDKPVPWRDALDYLCKTVNLVVVEEKHDVYRVMPKSALATQLETRIFQLKYLRPPSDYRAKIDVKTYAVGSATKPDASTEFTLLEILQNMLSGGGMLKYDAKTNSIIVKDTKPVLDEMEKVIKQLDIEPLLIMFSVNFVNTANDDLLKFGIDYTTTGETEGWKITSVPQSTSSGDAGTKTSLSNAPFGMGRELQAGVAGDYDEGKYAMGFLSTFDLTATLRLFSKDNLSKLEQRPFIMTLDGKEATIWVGEKVHYAQVAVSEATAGSGTSQVSISEAGNSPAKQGFQLLVVPHIIKGTNKIMLTIIPQNETLTGSRTTPPEGLETFTVTMDGKDYSIDLPRIQESTLVTHLIMEDNQTAVIGGLSTERSAKNVNKIPLLGDIPVIGHYLFRYTSDSVKKSHFLVFLTPKIIHNARESLDFIKDDIDELEKSKAELDDE